jgi:hypothetical protein
VTNDPKKPIDAPRPDAKRELTRAVAEAIAQTNPLTGGLARIYQTTHPSKSEQDRQAWREAISTRTNENSAQLDQHEEILRPTEELTGVTAHLIDALARACPDGMARKAFAFAEIGALLPDAGPQELEDAGYELETLGLVELLPGEGPWRLRLKPVFYTQFDHQVMGWNTEGDAAEIARLIVEDENGNAARLHAKTGWSKRRFNPAFRRVLELFPEGRISATLQPDYASPEAIYDRSDKPALMRFLKRILGGT